MTKHTLSQFIKEEALRLGFTHVGIAKAEMLEDEGAKFEEWLRRGYHGMMGYMERRQEERKDINKVLAGVKSVIAVAINYYTPTVHTDDPAIGKISRYAWGDDYHDVLTPRLEKLFLRLKEILPDVKGKWYVDTGPVLEKAWAVRSGLGWLGKHTNVITRDQGSWIFLGELLLDIELDYDSPINDFCGTCTACIEACPTQAITEPYVLDATKCISYATIELKARYDIPVEIAKNMEGWVYGCDICQDVCPWNSYATPSDEKSFLPREYNLAPRLEDLATISEEEFLRRTTNSPIARTKVEGMRRNVRADLRGLRDPGGL